MLLRNCRFEPKDLVMIFICSNKQLILNKDMLATKK